MLFKKIKNRHNDAADRARQVESTVLSGGISPEGSVKCNLICDLSGKLSIEVQESIRQSDGAGFVLIGASSGTRLFFPVQTSDWEVDLNQTADLPALFASETEYLCYLVYWKRKKVLFQRIKMHQDHFQEPHPSLDSNACRKKGYYLGTAFERCEAAGREIFYYYLNRERKTLVLSRALLRPVTRAWPAGDGTFEEFLKDPEHQPFSFYTTDVRMEDQRSIKVRLIDNDTPAKGCFLVLRRTFNGEDIRRLIQADISNGFAYFDFADSFDVLEQEGLPWRCYFAVCNEARYSFNVLQQAGPTARELAVSSKAGLYTYKQNMLGILSHGEGENDDSGLCVLLNDARNTVSLIKNEKEYTYKVTEGDVCKRVTEKAPAGFPFRFSVIMAVYNVEDYLEESIESIVQQDIGFTDHVQLILVDDGSPDHSGEICDRYKSLYPENVVVIHKENGGVSSARNAGLEIAQGKYINFLDSDDKLSINALSSVNRFFDENYYRTDIVTIPIMFFEAREGEHWQNYKFDKGSRVASLWREPNICAMFVTASFFKNAVAKKYRFDPALPVAEDALYIAMILLERMQIGLLNECNMWYRKRAAGGSLLNTSRHKKSWYFAYFENMVFYIMDYCKSKFGYVPQYIQSTIMMDLQWRFLEKEYPEGILTESEKAKYRDYIVKTLQEIEDNIIRAQRKLGIEYKIRVLEMKYQHPAEIVFTENDYQILMNGQFLVSGKAIRSDISFVSFEKGILSVDGTTNLTGLPSDASVDMYMMIAGDYYICEMTGHDETVMNCFGEVTYKKGFRVRIPIRPAYLNHEVHLFIRYKDHFVIKQKFVYRKFTPFVGNLKANYYLKDGVLFRGTGDHIWVGSPEEDPDIYEEEFLESIYEKCVVMPGDETILTDNNPNKLSVERFNRIRELRHYALHYKKERPIWLISDRPNHADDNGEAFFIFLMKQKELPADVFFVIDPDSKDYERLSAIGKVLPFGSDEHLKTHLVADLLISSQGEDYVFTPFGTEPKAYGYRKYFADLLCDKKFIFLQHGVTKDDVSGWLNRYNKNIYGFITTSDRETESIITYPYDYSADQVWQTGFPRFDRLYDDHKNQIVICPTWRKYLEGLTSDQFKKSEFFRFYEKLLTELTSLEEVKDHRYTVVLRPHPLMAQYLDAFTDLTNVTIIADEVPYRQTFAEGSLMLTDYSSTAMEFAYMRKPVIYTQFDRDEFFGGHTYTSGYFDYDTDGFGPVVNTPDEAVDEAVKLIRSHCKMEEKYLQRVNAFFPVNDYRNCRRVYEKLLQITD